MFNELYKYIQEQATAPVKPEIEPKVPTKPKRRRRRNPLKPEPGVHPIPKAETEDDELDGESNGNHDLEMFKRARA